MKIKPWHKIILAMIFGVITGLLLKERAQIFAPLGLIFMNLIKMIIVPLVFFTLIYGITSIEDSKDVKRVGLKAIFVFLSTAAFAAIIGILIATLIKPGIGNNLLILKDQDLAPKLAEISIIKMILEIVPTNAFRALAEGNILQILTLSFFVGFILNSMRESTKTLITFCNEAAQFSFKMIEVIMKLAPLGVFGYIASTVGLQGLSVLFALAKLILTIFIACGAQYLIFGLLILIWGKLSPLPFYKKMLEPQIIAFSTSSSKAALTTIIRVAEDRLGVSRKNSRFLIPLASVLNMDGGAIYQGACAVFFAQIFGIEFTLMQYATLVFMCTIASIGGAGIPGGVLLFLGMVLTSVGLPIEGIILIVSIDRVLDMATTVVNVTGDACATLLIDRSEGTLDENKYNAS